MECKLIGAEITSLKDETGVILDKVLKYCNGASITAYVCMSKDGSIFEIDFDEIGSILGFVTNPNSDFATYLTNYKTK